MRPLRIGLIISIFLSVLLQHPNTSANNTTETDGHNSAKALINSCDIPGGICVVLGRTDVELALSIPELGQFTVQTLFQDKNLLDRARKLIDRHGIYGKVSADLGQYNKLPYTENLINIIDRRTGNSRLEQ